MIEYIFLGLIQGLTEFLPVSSSGHLYLAQVLMDWEPTLRLEIFFHGASLLAVLMYFWKDIVDIFRHLWTPRGWKTEQGKLGLKLLAATGVTVPVALFFESYFDMILTPSLVGVTLLVTGGLILTAEKFRPARTRDFTWVLAVFLGLVQGIAVLPGISRSGITIAFLILMGLSRQKSARISFLLSIPTIMGAMVFALKDSSLVFQTEEIIGFAACVVASFVAIVWMMNLIKRHWIWFAPYCFVVGLWVLFLGL